MIELLARAPAPSIATRQTCKFTLRKRDRIRVRVSLFGHFQKNRLNDFISEHRRLPVPRMNVDRHRSLLAIGMFEHTSDRTVAAACLTRVETKQRAFDTQDGDLFRKPLFELEPGTLVEHSLLPHVVAITHDNFLRDPIGKIYKRPSPRSFYQLYPARRWRNAEEMWTASAARRAHRRAHSRVRRASVHSVRLPASVSTAK